MIRSCACSVPEPEQNKHLRSSTTREMSFRIIGFFVDVPLRSAAELTLDQRVQPVPRILNPRVGCVWRTVSVPQERSSAQEGMSLSRSALRTRSKLRCRLRRRVSNCRPARRVDEEVLERSL